MTVQSLLLLLVVLACPLMMVFMMRGHGGHGHGGHHEEAAADTSQGRASLAELRERRDDLDAQIQALEEQDGDRFRAR